MPPSPLESLTSAALSSCLPLLHWAARESGESFFAATAIRHELPVYTRNPDDFDGIDGLTVRPVR